MPALVVFIEFRNTGVSRVAEYRSEVKISKFKMANAEMEVAKFWSQNLLNFFEFRNNGIFRVENYESKNQNLKIQNVGSKMVDAKFWKNQNFIGFFWISKYGSFLGSRTRIWSQNFKIQNGGREILKKSKTCWIFRSLEITGFLGAKTTNLKSKLNN